MKKIIVIAALLVLGSGFLPRDSMSAEKFAVKEVGVFYYCSLPFKGSFTNMEQNIGLLMQYLQEQSIAPTGPMVGVYYNDPKTTKPEDIAWELGFPVGETNVLEPLKLKQWTFTTVAEAVHIGPYENAASVYGELMAWIDANGYVVAGPVMEKYMSDPNSTKPEALKTEIWVPVMKK